MDETSTWLKWLRRFRGPEGPQGVPGFSGDSGPRGPIGERGFAGLDFAPTPRLPVDVFVMTHKRDMVAVYRVRGIMEDVAEFWSDVGIHLIPRVVGADNAANKHIEAQLQSAHYYRFQGRNPSIYILMDRATVGGTNEYLGQAFLVDQLAVVAGAVEDGGLMDVINHELGHLLGLPHQAETFMREAIRPGPDNRVTTIQSIQLHESAAALGGH